MSDSMEWMKLAVMALGLIFNIAAYLYMRASNRDKATKEQIDTLETDLGKKLDGQGERIAKLETRAENSPTHEDLGSIHEKINHLSSQVSNLSGELKGVSNLLNTMHNYLLTGGKK